MSKIKTIHISDIHFGKKDDYKLYEELNNIFFDSLIDLKNNNELNKYECIFIQGDLFDRVIRMNEPTSLYIFKFIENLCNIVSELKNPPYIRIIKGTKGHDYNQLKTLEHFENRYEFFKIIHTYQEEEIQLLNDENKTLKILYIPEEYPENIKSYYNFESIEDNTYDYIIGHGMIDIVRFSSEEQKDETIKHGPIFKNKDLIRICKGPICFGHIHDYQEYKDKVFYTGSFSRFSFADLKDKGFLEFEYDLDDNSFDVSMWENYEAPTYKVIDLSDYDSYDSEERIKIINRLKEKFNFIKIKSSNKEDNIDILNQVLSEDSNIKLEVKKDIVDNEIDERFNFILKRELDLPHTIQKYIDITENKKIPLNIINKIINSEEN